ncbi:IPT/TIG domain protein [anaerobic digester metagenome]
MVRVVNPDGQSNAEDVVFSISHPVPVVISVNPDSGLTSEESVEVTITGSGFLDGCVLHLRDSESGEIIVTSGQTVVTEEGNSVCGSFDLSGVTAGNYVVRVVNPDGQSNVEDVVFSISHPVPVVISVNPDSGLTSEESVEVTVTGSGFLDGCVLHLRDPESGEIVVNSGPTGVNEGGTSVQGIFDLSGLSVGDYVVRVVNPDGQMSAGDVVFSVGHPTPVVISVNPDSGLTSEESVEVTITGSGFLDGCILHLRDPESGEIVVTSGPTVVTEEGTSVQGTFDLSGVTAGNYLVRVVNPDGQSNAEDVVFSISHPVPVVISVNPDSGLTSEESVEVTVTGSGFLDGCVLHLRDPESGEIVVTSGPTVITEERTSVRGSFDLTGVIAGEYNLYVENPNGVLSFDTVIFRIQSPPNPSYEITIHSGNGGKTEPHGIVIVSESSDLSIRSTPRTGYTVKNVYLDSIPQGPVPVFTLPDIRSKHYVFVEFSQIPPVPTPIPTIIPIPPPTPDPIFYSISVSSDYGSMITPNGTITVPKGSLIPFQMTPLTDFHIVHLLVDTIPVHVHNSWILNPVTKDHEIHLVSDRNISPNWANFSLLLSEGNETRNISIISESYPDATWEFWDFGDGVTAYGNPINHTYQSAGNFSITRKVVFQNSSSQCRREIRI